MTIATPKDTFDHAIGAGALTYSWWLAAKTANVDTPEWTATLTGGEDDEPVTVIVSHELVLRAARAVLITRPRFSSDAFIEACRNLIYDADEADFDAATSDELLQMIVFGEIIYG